MKNIKYISVLPGGNKTALVLGDGFTPMEKKGINDAIMAADLDIEQVGFVHDISESMVTDNPTLQMAGGEFCGNATRSAAYYYLQGKPGELTMIVSGGRQVACGVYKGGDAWCEIPLEDKTVINMRDVNAPSQISLLAPGISKVSLSGITHLVLEPETAAPYLEKRENLKQQGLTLIEEYNLKELEAAGAIFTEHLPDGSLKINPIVWVRDIGSLFYETACGSGTVAAAMVMAQKNGHSDSLEILQPSGMVIKASVTLEKRPNGTMFFSRAVISGPVKTELKPQSILL